ncbi:threonine ammonia-lyase [Dongia rigui]|uniref:Threonine/serine dehydratase n=1 Tax=Dongia rigui TaxID=940149 RepID=A0ABU5DZ25_9PROT|nr:threonine/serine dehydratase [Dongia rigui]MDY0872529.1 threonine/serine dehydratase [Dongia rigui]
MNQPSAKLAVGIEDVRAAAARLNGVIVTTPLLDYPLVSERLGFRLLIKAETLQITGSFKFRGASNRLLAAKDTDPAARAVVAFSSGNHAQGVAAAAKLLGFKATIVMPSDAPAIKVANTRGYGAEVVLYQRHTEDREAIARKIAEKDGALIVPPYDDPYIIAGQGTAGLEIVVQVKALGTVPDLVIAPCSGGGLVGGVATAVKDAFPNTAVYAAEPAGYDDLNRSLAAGERLPNKPTAPSICDALMAQTPGALTFPIHRKLLAGSKVVSDDAVLDAMSFAQRHLKLVVEPGGAAGLAAVLAMRGELKGRTAVVICSGGNADPEMIKRAADRGDPLL